MHPTRKHIYIYILYSTTVNVIAKIIILRYTTLRHNGLWELFDTHLPFLPNVKKSVSLKNTTNASAFYFKQHFSTSEVILQKTRKRVFYFLSNQRYKNCRRNETICSFYTGCLLQNLSNLTKLSLRRIRCEILI